MGISILFTLISCGHILAQQKTPIPAEFVNWLPISAAQLQLKSPSVEPDAGAEVLEWRIHVVDELLGDNRDLQRVFYNYVRLKIFDEKGKEKAATIDLPYGDHRTILDVAGRTVKADGSIVELDKKAVYKRDLVRADDRKLKGVSFAMPGVEPGVIVEYRWREVEDDNRFRYLRMPFQREFPVQRVTYYVKPLPGEVTGGEQMFMSPFNCRPSPLQQEKDGSSSTFVENAPALHDEVFSPSESNLSEWALLRYQKEAKRDPENIGGNWGSTISKN